MNGDMERYFGYLAMAVFFLLIIGALAATVCYIYYGITDRTETQIKDHYESHETSAYGAIISLLGAIMLLLWWVAYKVHKHMYK